MPPRQADATGSIVRVWLRADDNPERVGHLALITKSSPEQGLYAKLCTTGVAHETWLQHEQKSIQWDWLQNLKARARPQAAPHPGMS